MTFPYKGNNSNKLLLRLAVFSVGKSAKYKLITYKQLVSRNFFLLINKDVLFF